MLMTVSGIHKAKSAYWIGSYSMLLSHLQVTACFVYFFFTFNLLSRLSQSVTVCVCHGQILPLLPFVCVSVCVHLIASSLFCHPAVQMLMLMIFWSKKNKDCLKETRSADSLPNPILSFKLKKVIWICIKFNGSFFFSRVSFLASFCNFNFFFSSMAIEKERKHSSSFDSPLFLKLYLRFISLCLCLFRWLFWGQCRGCWPPLFSFLGREHFTDISESFYLFDSLPLLSETSAGTWDIILASLFKQYTSSSHIHWFSSFHLHCQGKVSRAKLQSAWPAIALVTAFYF